MNGFPGFMEKVGPFLAGDLGISDEREFKRLLCADCAFFKPGEDEELECGCYRMLSLLIEKGCLTLEQIKDGLER